jgi:alpha-beta hydrolase superfamily lysophospholipase
MEAIPMKRKEIFVAVVIVVLMIIGYLVFKPAPKGAIRFFKDQPYNFQVLRTLGHAPFGGSDSGEILSIVKDIREGDDESWYESWMRMARRVEGWGRALTDRVGRGRALLRAHDYYRTAEFFLHPRDERRKETFRRSVETFFDALRDLRVRHQVIPIPYGKHTLKAVYYPGAHESRSRPLIVVHGGYDSTLEELYFMIAAGARERGYACLTFEGPGQGSVIREQGLQFTPEWEKPTGAVLDEFIKRYGKPGKIVLIGASLGGYLAPRAAAFDKRIDGVVSYDVCYDFQEAALMQVPAFMRFLYRSGFVGIVNTLIEFKMRNTPGVRWGVRNAQWTMGAKDPADLLRIFDLYNLRDEAEKITADVLILAGEADHFFPVEQVDKYKRALARARSVTARVFTEAEGGHEHCQVGAFNLFHGVLFNWIEEKF